MLLTMSLGLAAQKHNQLLHEFGENEYVKNYYAATYNTPDPKFND